MIFLYLIARLIMEKNSTYKVSAVIVSYLGGVILQESRSKKTDWKVP